MISSTAAACRASRPTLYSAVCSAEPPRLSVSGRSAPPCPHWIGSYQQVQLWHSASRLSVLAAATKKSGKGKGKQAQAEVQAGDEGSDEEGGVEGEEDIIEDEIDSDVDFEGPQIVTGGMPWADAALEITQEILHREEMKGLELYAFAAIPSSKVLRLRLDKLEDEYGSPSLEDITNFSRALSMGLDERFGEEVSGDIEMEVSSPGAERVLRLPGELARFQNLPLRVQFLREDGKVDTKVLRLKEYDAEGEMTTWGLADVAVNKQGKKKGQGLNRKERDAEWRIPVATLQEVRVHLDI